MTWYNPFTWFSKPKSIETTVSDLQFKKYRKPSDTTKITKQMYDFILLKKEEQDEYNINKIPPQLYETTEELCDYLNMCFGTNFSRSKLTKVWTGKLNRDELPDGPEITIPF
jgi:hypothetical protein